MNMMQTTRRAARNVTTGFIGTCMFPQNGVVEGSVLYGSGASSSPQLNAAAALDTHIGNIDPGGAAKHRTSALEVSSMGGFAAKNHRGDSDDIDDGSLPCTPELQSHDDVLDSDTRRLISRFLSDFTGLTTSSWTQSKAQSTMKRVVSNVLDKHRYKYNGIINTLSLDNHGDDMDFVSAVAKSLFSDGTTNWGRIASLVAFGAAVSQYLKDKNREHCVELVAQEISSYLLVHQQNWLVKNNSWDGFVEFFQEADPEATMRNTLMAFAGFASIGATLALLIR
ncbi:induced myeloid leukemia cell differentiation protein Mcl-1b [Dunckerocampus dactyliophorus]|uniref:induced myeloid leukemia cell differentiation protein Mcl-1b n=1 Tax=Dunckerocampus dactyliophorus TaxID=161453 RepID=UPI0024073445|nr:induced myeloid leukemia cell differentiation protein Mcl-1b [Dunckerocampus dactyliophorus]